MFWERYNAVRYSGQFNHVCPVYYRLSLAIISKTNKLIKNIFCFIFPNIYLNHNNMRSSFPQISGQNSPNFQHIRLDKLIIFMAYIDACKKSCILIWQRVEEL